MDKKPHLYFEMDKRVTTEDRCSITTYVHGTIRGSGGLTYDPDVMDKVAEIMKNFPNCAEFTVLAGEYIKVVLLEKVIKKEYPFMGTYSKDRLNDIAGLFGTFDLR